MIDCATLLLLLAAGEPGVWRLFMCRCLPVAVQLVAGT